MTGPLSNPKHELFAQGLAKGLTSDEAYVEAGYKPNRGNAARLKANENILRRTAELTGQAAEKAVLDRAWILNMLQKNAVKCLGENDKFRNPTAGNRALELLGKELGMFVDRRLLGVRRIEDMSEEELLEFLGGEPEPEEIGAAAGTPPAGHA